MPWNLLNARSWPSYCNSFRILAVLITVLAFPLRPLAAQPGGSEKVVAHTPDQTLALISVWPHHLASQERMRLAPLEVFTAAGLENVGIDPLQIERLDVMIGFPGPMGPQFGALVQMVGALDVSKLPPDLLGEGGLQTEGDFEYYQLSLPGEWILHPIDESTAMVGTRNFVKQMDKATGNGKVAQIAAKVRNSQAAMAIVDFGTLRPMLQGFVNASVGELPPQLYEDVLTIVEVTDFAALRIVIDEEEKLQLILVASAEPLANNLENSLANVLHLGREMLIAEAKTEIDAQTQTGAAMHAYLDRLSDEILRKLRPRRSGSRLVVEVEPLQDTSVIGMVTGLLLPAAQSARLAAGRTVSNNNLRQVGLALHNFASAYKALPATAGVDDQGKPMISWRVAILPFLGETALYEKFNLEEPWDSEHNLALLEQMPDVFKHPNRTTKAGYTVYQAVVGEKTLLRLKEPTRFRDITDGTSNTIMVLEATSEVAVPWTAPQDYEVDMDDPSQNLFEEGITNVLFGDGSVRPLPQSISPDTLKALYTRAGGEMVNDF